MFKYINIASFKAESYFSRISPVTSASNDMTPQETITYMNSELTYFKCERLCTAIQKAIQNIISSSSCIMEILPEDVISIGTMSVPLNPERLEFLLPFFEWLKKLISENNNMRAHCKSEVRRTASFFSEPFSSFIEALSSSSVAHRISIMKDEENKIQVKTIDRLWGHAGFTAKSAELSGELPSFGTLEWFEADVDDEQLFTFKFLINENFSDVPLNILNNNNYSSIEITAEKPSFFSKFSNYVGFIRESGIKTENACEILLGELGGKADTLGEGVLDVSEKNFLPFARLFHAINFTDKKISTKKSNMPEIFSSLENRFTFDKIIDFLEKSDSESVKGLAKVLRDTAENFDADSINDSIAYIKHAFRYFNVFFPRESRSRFELAELVLENFTVPKNVTLDDSEYIACFDIAVNSLKTQLEENLFEKGFSGEFPNYSKTCGGIVSLITITCRLGSYTPKFGVFSYKFSLSLAQYSTANSQIPQNACAVDLQNANCKHAQIASEADGGELELIYNLYTGENNLQTVYNDSIKNFVDVALAAFDNSAIPKFYRKAHLKKLQKHSIWRAILNSLPFIAIAAIVFLICAKIIFDSGFTTVVSLPFFMIGIAVCILSVAVVEIIRKNFSIWKN